MEKFCSHLNTPPSHEIVNHPGIIKYENVIYCAHPLDLIYFENATKIHRDIFEKLVDILLEEPIVETDLPSEGRISLLHFPEKK